MTPAPLLFSLCGLVMSIGAMFWPGAVAFGVFLSIGCIGHWWEWEKVCPISFMLCASIAVTLLFALVIAVGLK